MNKLLDWQLSLAYWNIPAGIISGVHTNCHNFMRRSPKSINKQQQKRANADKVSLAPLTQHWHRLRLLLLVPQLLIQRFLAPKNDVAELMLMICLFIFEWLRHCGRNWERATLTDCSQSTLYMHDVHTHTHIHMYTVLYAMWYLPAGGMFPDGIQLGGGPQSRVRHFINMHMCICMCYIATICLTV